MKIEYLIFPILFFLSITKTSAQCQALFAASPVKDSTFVVFANASPSSIGGVPTEFQWDFGDGSLIDTARNPVYFYTADSTYTVCLTTTAGFSCSATYCETIIVGTNNHIINAVIETDTMSRYNCMAPHAVNFNYAIAASGYPWPSTLYCEINFGDGVDSVFSLPINDSFTHSMFEGLITHVYQNPGNYNPHIMIMGPDSVTDNYSSQNIYVGSSCGNVSGIVYQDLNGNCLFDGGEQLNNIGLSIISNTTNWSGWAISDSTGLYTFNVPLGGTYNIYINRSNGIMYQLMPSCPPSGILTVNVPSSSNNFGVVCPSGFDLSGTVTAFNLRPGFTGQACVNVFNNSCTTPNGQIEILLSSNLTPLSDTSGIGYTINGNTVTFPIDSTIHSWSFCFPVRVDVNAQINDSACFDLNLIPVTGDFNPYNNHEIFCFAIRNSWDPNDKYANPSGEGVDGFIRPNTDLTYTIRFQNTGNADAVNIYILDTLSSNLDAASLEVIGHSHPMTYSLLTGNILRFNFDNIHLLDSNANEPASHGYVTYRIKQSPNIAQLAQITNTAYIYFDFNPAIVTNTTLNTMDQFLSSKTIDRNSTVVSLFPNPANQKCMIYFGDNHRRTISVSDILGKEVFLVTSSTESYLLNTEKFENGIYMVQIKVNNNQIQTGKLIIAH